LVFTPGPLLNGQGVALITVPLPPSSHVVRMLSFGGGGGWGCAESPGNRDVSTPDALLTTPSFGVLLPVRLRPFAPNPVQPIVAHVALQPPSATSNFLQTFYDSDAMWTDLNFRWFLEASLVYGPGPTLTKTPSSVDGEYVSVECPTIGKIPTKVYLSTWRSDAFDQYFKSPVFSFWTNMYKPTVNFGSL